MSCVDFIIRKDDLRQTLWQECITPPLAEGAVRLKIDAFALTANNVTYAAFGEMMHYWQFFPADKGWGRVPVWGFATVTQSSLAGIEPGRRVYGYLPISETLDVMPAAIGKAGFTDSMPHRADLAHFYNLYHFTDSDPAYDAAYEAQQMLFRPLYATGWWLKDTLTRKTDPALAQIILSSASSKTALALAHSLKTQGDCETIGLTSPGNRSFVESTNLYARTLVYEDLASLSSDGPAAYVDFIGRPEVTQGVHETLGDALRRSIIVGATDWEGDRTPRQITGPEPEFFFVPDYAMNRIAEDGPELPEAMNRDLRAFYPASQAIISPEKHVGREAIDRAWQDTLERRVPPDRGLILSLT